MHTALVIDDSAIMRRSLKAILESAGLRVVGEAASGDDALALYEQHHPTLVTMDIVMPGKDGLTAATEILRKHPEATIIMCSSLAARDKILACQRAGVKHYLLKPFEPAKARAIIEFTLARLPNHASRGAERAV
jgi:two-component system chemotaxis response regulator CheY